ncbi:MAG: DNA polymerase III subunit alpha [Buchnera aphidicola (Periphyllus lyropictus)]|uniref:DNA polymerase III subunit alpha n=1 Tax=Buchnera aphidicola TaxID=9 RepID=UPI001EB8100D|nr:DNA polymerase III subunit alpha [Buchnera aphidicola]NIH16633.1 DNA polymerase III subunit alpha [Buchnera aphidicola (Periphyllus lyropictus)]USS94544.1 DNA polymerase III subunit alpha [Buchnera aphidicola (Periphyllus lyropictus)]
MSNISFIHLRTHSDYSIIDGLSKPKKIIDKAIFFNMPSVGITDFTNLYGVIKFYKYAHKNGIKPIIGADFNLLSEDNTLSELTILASNNFGYENLKILISKAYKRKYKILKDVYIKKKWLIKYRDGLIILSGGIDGEISKFIFNKKSNFLNSSLSFYKKYFNQNYYLEISRIGRIEEEKYIKKILEISFFKKIPIVCTNNVRFLKKNDFYSHFIRISIHNGISIDLAKKLFYKYKKNQFFKSTLDMKKLFFDIPESLYNSVEIAKRCNVSIKFKKYFLPKFFTGKKNTKDFLVKISKKGLLSRLKKNNISKKKNLNIYKIYKNRLIYELKIINKMGFSSYFLIVMEFIQWSKRKNIPVGPGRGSGAGSLVSYSLKITEIDPIKFDLLFERFLNIERVSMPDFDVDFCMNRRDLVIEHVSKVYGKDSVSQIITFGTMTAKAVIRDVGRSLGYPYGFLNRISKLIPLDPGITLKKAILNSSELSMLYNHDCEIRDLFNSTKKLEGVIRNVGKHAGGVVISPTKITNFSPLYYDNLEKKNSVTQFDKDDIEDIGLVKFDFLGLKTLTIIFSSIKMINKNLKKKGKNKIYIEDISLNDKKSFKMLMKAYTTSIFQLESFGIKELILQLKPDSFDDIVALVALFRPGPLQSGMVENFINRKHRKEKIYYPDKKWEHKLLKPILKSTYGIILYQEQVMKIAQIFSNYTLGEADLLRRAISKKNFKKMSKHRVKFVKGAKKNNIKEILSNKIFDLLEKFAGYGFNKSHSVAYALISYQTLWLKSNFSSEFMASAMTMDMRYSNKIMILVNECIKLNLKIYIPNINFSKNNFFVDLKKNIFFGLGALKGIGENTIKKIILERKKNGIFKSLSDLCIRVGPKIITKKILEKLIFSGACDCFNKSRFLLYISISDVVQSSLQYRNILLSKQLDFFDKKEINLEKKYKNKFFININWSKKLELDYEKNILGFYLSNHPFLFYLKEIRNYYCTVCLNKIFNFKKNQKIYISGIIFSIKRLLTKNKKKMVILTLDDNTKKIDVLVFEDLILSSQSILKENNIIIVKGFTKKNIFKNSFCFIAKKIYDIYNLRKKKLLKIKVILKRTSKSIIFFNKIDKFMIKYCGGKTNLCIIIYNNKFKKKKYLIKKWNVYPSDNLFYFLKSLKFLESIKKFFI